VDYQKYCFTLQSDTTVNDIISKIDKVGIGSIVVVDTSFRLVGIVTDGDVRRAILEDKLELKNIINYHPDTWPITKTIQSGITHLKKIRRNILPVIDSDKYVKDIINLQDSSYDIVDNYVVLMAGGLGTRLMPLTKDIPKPLLPINGKPILERIIEKLIAQGFINFYISINYLGEKIKDYFGDGSRWDTNIKYIEEDKRLGTAGALSKIKNILKEPFIVMNGDIITDLNFRELLDFHIKNNSMATMCVYKQIHQIPFGVVEFDTNSNILALKEKPKQEYYINMGIYTLNPEIENYIPDDTFFDMPTLFENLIDDNKICNVYNFDGIWNDIGRIEEYKEINLIGG